MYRTEAEGSLMLTPDQMRTLGYQVVDMLVEHFETLPSQLIGRKAGRELLEARLREPVPEEATDPEAVLRQVEDVVLSNILHLDHPRFFAFIPSPSNFPSVLADALASGFNVYAGTWLEGSGPAVIELVTVDWLRQLCGLPETAGGLFVSGGSAANLTALAVARDVRLGGRMDGAVVYFSDQTHVSVERGLHVLGFTREQIRRIGSDGNFRLRPSDLQRAIESDRAEGKAPFCVVANAGTTNTGAVDPLDDLAAVCAERDLWLHVDGAYGVAAVVSDKGRKLLAGLERADSLALDPHKWLFQPYEAGCVLVRDRRLLQRSFLITPEYLRDLEPKEDEVNFCHWGIQLTRAFRALKLWMSLKIYGLGRFRTAIERGFELAEEAERIIRQSAHLKIVTPARMGILTFRFEHPGWPEARADGLHQNLVNEIMADGYAMLSSTVLRGRTVLRMCTINPRTRTSDLRATVEKIEALGSRLAFEARGGLTSGP